MRNLGRLLGSRRPERKTPPPILLTSWVLSVGLLILTWPGNLRAQQEPQYYQQYPQYPAQGGYGAPPGQPYGPDQQYAAPLGEPGPGGTYVRYSPQQLQDMLAPVALYPDSLVAQILAASQYPDQVQQANQFLQQNSGLTGDALAQAVDQQPWDPSVKALTAFPSVLGNMAANLSWTQDLGAAYYNQQPDVMNTIQVLRQQAEQAGTLQSTPQQTVTTQGSDIAIEPTNPNVVYVPAYDPWLVYGAPLTPWPGWYEYPGVWFGGPYLSFGPAFSIGFFGGFGWGWHHWGLDWGHRFVAFNHGRYIARGNGFVGRNGFGGRNGFIGRNGFYGGGARAFNQAHPAYGGGARYQGQARQFSGGARMPYAGEPRAYARVYPGGAAGGSVYNRPTPQFRSFGNNLAPRSYAQPRFQGGTRFGSIQRGGQTHAFSSGGHSSFHSGGGVHSFGGGHASGGFHGGGGRPHR